MSKIQVCYMAQTDILGILGMTALLLGNNFVRLKFSNKFSLISKVSSIRSK